MPDHGATPDGARATSSASYDLHVKKEVYREHGVQEYLVWRVLDREIDWFVLHNGEYEPLKVGTDGLFRSTTFPGLWLDPAALLTGNGAQVLSALQQGLACPEHAAFVKRLAGS